MNVLAVTLSLLVLLVHVGCGNDGEVASGPAPVATTDAALPATPANAAVVTIRTLTAGDRGCYVGIESTSGDVTEEIAAFELCEQQALVGKRVTLTREPGEIMAESCEGNPECDERESVTLIVAATAVE